jgi:hypothetical protein
VTRRVLPGAVALASAALACTLTPSPLGELPGTTTDAPATTTVPDPPTSATTDPTTTAPTTTDPTTTTTVDPPDTAWELYCAHINAHGGRCDPGVDEFPDLAYPGRGFIVHEWGTDTVVLGSDGATLRGLQHDEEMLPEFVAERVPAGSLPGSVSVHVKMETPITYFYSEQARTAAVAVDFPDGVFNQWYPPVAAFAPFIAAPGAVPKLGEYRDPVLDVAFPFGGDICRDLYAVIGGGRLEWGELEVLAPDAEVPLLPAPLAESTWSHARQVAANLVRVTGVPGAETPQHERFLFYRGLGNFSLPLTLTTGPAGALTLGNDSSTAVGRLFVLNVDAERGAFVEVPAGLAPGESLQDLAPDLGPAPPLELFADALDERVTEALDAAGLYHDEALAMVATWKRQWFRSPGLRVLYLVPQAWTDASIPLTIDPAPEARVRVMMIRSELLTPEQEAADVAAAGLIADPDTQATGAAHFLALGRFAEPRLRRAAGLLGQPAYLGPLLTQVARADTRVAAGE